MPVLIVPGLLSGVPAHDPVPADLAAWTRHGRGQQHTGAIESILFEVFGYRPARVAVAALTYLGLTGEVPKHWMIRADPVHLHPRREQLILISGEQLDLPGEHARRIAETVRSVLSGYGLTLIAEDRLQWVVASENVSEIDTHDLWSVSGHDIDPVLPQGAESRAWLTLLTEVQMALHQDEINQLRARDDRLEVNSVWFWGSGVLPPPPILKSGKAASGTLFTDDAVARGFANWTGTRVKSLPADFEAFRAEIREHGDTPETSAVLFGGGYLKLALQDENMYRAYLADWSRRWGRPLHQALQTGDIDSVTLIDPGTTKLTVRTDQLRPWWQRIISRPQIRSAD